MIVPTEAEDREIAAGIASDPDAAPDFGNGLPPGFTIVGRPKSLHPKEALNIRLDADVLEHFRATGPGWQTRINAALRKAAGL
ncbi:MAG: BrnA antitoxin family protein [Beijerinckiaceae bacterium]